MTPPRKPPLDPVSRFQFLEALKQAGGAEALNSGWTILEKLEKRDPLLLSPGAKGIIAPLQSTRGPEPGGCVSPLRPRGLGDVEPNPFTQAAQLFSRDPSQGQALSWDEGAVGILHATGILGADGLSVHTDMAGGWAEWLFDRIANVAAPVAVGTLIGFAGAAISLYRARAGDCPGQFFLESRDWTALTAEKHSRPETDVGAFAQCLTVEVSTRIANHTAEVIPDPYNRAVTLIFTMPESSNPPIQRSIRATVTFFSQDRAAFASGSESHSVRPWVSIEAFHENTTTHAKTELNGETANDDFLEATRAIRECGRKFSSS